MIDLENMIVGILLLIMGFGFIFKGCLDLREWVLEATMPNDPLCARPSFAVCVLLALAIMAGQVFLIAGTLRIWGLI